MACTSAEPSATLFEIGMYIGISAQDILYGIELVLYFRTMRTFLARRRRPHKGDMFYAIFSTVMLILITIWVAASSTLGQKMWLLHRDYPEGPMAYHDKHSSALYMDCGRFSLAILQQMADALMIYRCRVVWGSRRVIVVPSILWFTNLGLGFLLDSTTSMPGTTFFDGFAAKLVLTYYSSSVFLNMVLASMICYRLLRHARTVRRYLGDKYASPYITIVVLVVESMLPLVLSGIIFLVLYGVRSQSEAAVIITFIHPLIMCISPQILILHAARADAWHMHESIVAPESLIRALPDHADMSNPGRFDGSGLIMRLETLSSVHGHTGHEDHQV